MTSSFKVKYGQTFDNIFIEGEGTQTFGIIDSDGVDVGQKYLPASDGDPQDPCGFLDSTGEDIGPKLCKPGTNWTHAVTPVYTYTDELGGYWRMYAATKTVPWDQDIVNGGRIPVGGTIVTRDGCTPLAQIESWGSYDPGYGDAAAGWYYGNRLALDGITEGEYWNVTRIDTKVTYLCKAFLYTSFIYGNSALWSDPSYHSTDMAVCFLTPADKDKTVYLKIEKA